ncbi:uncharacterized protein LOC143469684 isoform X1 [Clavelina lepadiformis]|uniref:uncharacterized protein LOC143469684 isoform X1 n=1 Tax=Clavelina lepadiformis TaxID=159417 RepID=UPI0040435AF0
MASSSNLGEANAGIASDTEEDDHEHEKVDETTAEVASDTKEDDHNVETINETTVEVASDTKEDDQDVEILNETAVEIASDTKEDDQEQDIVPVDATAVEIAPATTEEDHNPEIVDEMAVEIASDTKKDDQEQGMVDKMNVKFAPDTKEDDHEQRKVDGSTVEIDLDKKRVDHKSKEANETTVEIALDAKDVVNGKTERAEMIRKASMAVCAAFLAGSLGLFIFSVQGLPAPGDVCRNISEAKRTGRHIDIASSPIQLNLCSLKRCRFDIKSCSEECPFGYKSDEKNCPNSCECQESGLFQGDVQFVKEEIPLMTKMFISEEEEFSSHFDLIDDIASNAKIYSWGIGETTINVLYDSQLGNETILAIKGILRSFRYKTCITFQQIENEVGSYVYVTKGDFCSAGIGLRAKKNTVFVSEHCIGSPGIEHLFMHVLGFDHEQTRADRDGHVKIDWKNIIPGRKSAFGKLNHRYWLDFDIEYNGQSLMHFPHNAFAKQDRKPTISGKNGMKIRGQKKNDLFIGLRDTDYLKIKTLYRCPDDGGKSKAAHWSEWSSWSTNEDIHPKCRRERKCYLNGRNGTFGVCVTLTHEVAKVEIASINNCEQAKDWKAPTTNRTGRAFVSGGFKIPEVREELFNGTPVAINSHLCMNGRLISGHFTYDWRSDLLCHMDDGFIRIFAGTKKGMYSDIVWEGSTSFCRFDEEAELIAGDVSGDFKDDLLCRHSDGSIEVLVQKDSIFFGEPDWEGDFPGCVEKSTQVYLEDVNGDSKADLLCSPKTGVELQDIYISDFEELPY